MKRSFGAILLIAILSVAATSVVLGSPRCRGCNLVDEGSLNQYLVGQTVYGRTSRGFLPATVERVGTNPPAIFWRASDGRGAWDDARSYYTVGAYRELVADGRARIGPGTLNPIDIESRDRLWAICRGYMAARNRARSGGEVAALWLTQRACCQSTDAHRFGTPPGAC